MDCIKSYWCQRLKPPRAGTVTVMPAKCLRHLCWYFFGAHASPKDPGHLSHTLIPIQMQGQFQVWLMQSEPGSCQGSVTFGTRVQQMVDTCTTKVVRRKSPVAVLCLLLGRWACEIICRAGDQKSRLREVCVCWGVGYLGICVVLESFSGTTSLIIFHFWEVYFWFLFLFFKK